MSAVVNEDGIEVGMTCSFSCWTDRYAGIVTAVTKKTFTVSRLHDCKQVGEYFGDQTWVVNRHELEFGGAPTSSYVVRKNKYGGFVYKGYRFSKPRIMTDEELGECVYMDPSF